MIVARVRREREVIRLLTAPICPYRQKWSRLRRRQQQLEVMGLPRVSFRLQEWCG